MKRAKRFTTGFLYSSPSFLSGMATAINLAGNYYEYNESNSDCEADYKAIKNDFDMIGQDLNDLIEAISIDKNKFITSK